MDQIEEIVVEERIILVEDKKGAIIRVFEVGTGSFVG